jgi:hypothetical protein
LSDKPTPILEQRLLIIRIIHGSLCMGVAIATAVLAGARLASRRPPAATPMIAQRAPRVHDTGLGAQRHFPNGTEEVDLQLNRR